MFARVRFAPGYRATNSHYNLDHSSGPTSPLLTIGDQSGKSELRLSPMSVACHGLGDDVGVLGDSIETTAVCHCEAAFLSLADGIFGAFQSTP